MSRTQTEDGDQRNEGFTLVELLIVIVILGILATVTVFAVRGITDKGTKSACDTDKTTLQTATEAYFGQYGGTTIPSTTTRIAGALFTSSPAVTGVAATPVPSGAPSTFTAFGANPADTLVNAGFLRAAPANYYVGPDGKLQYMTSKCLTGSQVIGSSAG